MSMNNDYILNILAKQQLQDLHAQAASDRLAQQATAGRQPWWRRLAGLATAARPDAAANGAQAPHASARGPRVGASHVAR